MLDHALRTVSFIADIGDVLVLMARQPPEEHHNQEVVKPSQILASVGTAQTDHKNIKITCHVFQAPEVCLTKMSHYVERILKRFPHMYLDTLSLNSCSSSISAIMEITIVTSVTLAKSFISERIS